MFVNGKFCSRTSLSHWLLFLVPFPRMLFDVGGCSYGLYDHPIIVLLGETGIGKYQSGMVGDNTNDHHCGEKPDNSKRVSPAFPYSRADFPILKHLRTIDLHFLPNILNRHGIRTFRGNVEVTRAGIMRLVLEVDDKQHERWGRFIEDLLHADEQFEGSFRWSLKLIDFFQWFCSSY